MWCTRVAGFSGIFEHLSGCEFFLFPSRVHARPGASTANHKYPQEAGSPILVLQKTTPGPPGTGTCYREVVQMLPFYRGERLSEITRFEPNEYLEEDFRGAGMYGHLTYQFRPEKEGTKLIQRETLHYQGRSVEFFQGELSPDRHHLQEACNLVAETLSGLNT